VPKIITSMKLPAASSGISFCMQKSVSWQAGGI